MIKCWEAIQETVKKCIECGKRTSRGLMYCESCRKLHFLDALKHVRQADLQPEITNNPAITNSDNKVQIVPERSGKVSFPMESINPDNTSQKVTRMISSAKNRN